ncbi:hypothetical protein Tco_1500353 [Tanacetum coccineum]
MSLQDTIQISLVEQKSCEEQEAKENVELVKEHLAAKEIEKMVEEPENVVDDSSNPKIDEHDIPGTRIEPRSDKERLKVEITDSEKVDNVEEEITNVVNIEEYRNTPFPTSIRSPRIHDTLVSSDTEKLQELTAISTPSPSLSSSSTKVSTTNCLLSLFKAKPGRFKCYKSFFQELQGRYGYLFGHLKARFMEKKLFNILVDHLQTEEMAKKMIDAAIQQERVNLKAEIYSQVQNVIANNIPSQVDASVRSYMSSHILHVHPAQPTTSSAQEQQYHMYLSMKDDLQLQQKGIAIWLDLKMKFERLQVPATTCRTPAVRPRDQDDPHDDAHPEGENSAKWQKMSEYEAYVSGESSSGQMNESDQGPSSSGNQEQVDDYDFWTDSYASDDDEIPTKLVSQDIMDEVSLTIDEAMLKKVADEMLRQRCTSGDEHQYHIDQMKNFLESDIVWESRKEILVSPHPRKATPLVQSFQRDPEAPALSLINQDLLYLKKGKIVARRANECIVSITEPDFKNLNKNDIEDMYLLIMNGKLGVESYQQKVNLIAPTISFSGVEKHKMFSIIYEPVYGIIYKNSKKEKKVTRHSEIHKFCDATLNRVLKGLKSYNNDVKYGYIQRELTKEDVEYLQLFEDEIDERLKHHNQMRCWEECNVNEKPTGP